MPDFNAQFAVLIVPACAAVALAVLKGYRLSALLNAACAGLTLLAALSLLFVRPPAGNYLQVDDLNVVFIVLTTFVGFTTSAFSASYIGYEIATGKL
ncbi:MAG: hydrogenase 4 subunit F, partial [Methylobacteriaceae bacterium]|nr:hydrogenase 4 subunit F [Methylobacteriaceae bacterium]